VGREERREASKLWLVDLRRVGVVGGDDDDGEEYLIVTEGKGIEGIAEGGVEERRSRGYMVDWRWNCVAELLTTGRQSIEAECLGRECVPKYCETGSEEIQETRVVLMFECKTLDEGLINMYYIGA
jgi:hypothetical protein